MSLSTSTRSPRRRRSSKPTIFLDRNLGNGVEAALERFGQFNIMRMKAVYPNHGEAVPDVEWIARAGAEGWLVFTQDEAVRKRPDERAAIVEHGAKVFALSSQQLLIPSKTLWYGRHLLPIVRRGRKPGACLWRLYPTHTVKDIA